MCQNPHYERDYAVLQTALNLAQKSCHKLTQIEEESLKQRILSLDLRGAAPTPGHVREMANLLLAKRGSIPIQTVGEKWVYNYTQRHPELTSRFSRRYDYRRAQQEDPRSFKRGLTPFKLSSSNTASYPTIYITLTRQASRWAFVRHIK
jgi:hypothetical protein